jgi:hypothetical protein
MPAFAPVDKPEEPLLSLLAATSVGAPGVLVKVAGATTVEAASVVMTTEVIVVKPATPSDEVTWRVWVTKAVLVSYTTEELETVITTGVALEVLESEEVGGGGGSDEVVEVVGGGSDVVEDVVTGGGGGLDVVVVEDVVTGGGGGLEVVVVEDVVGGGGEDVVAEIKSVNGLMDKISSANKMAHAAEQSTQPIANINSLVLVLSVVELVVVLVVGGGGVVVDEVVGGGREEDEVVVGEGEGVAVDEGEL